MRKSQRLDPRTTATAAPGLATVRPPQSRTAARGDLRRNRMTDRTLTRTLALLGCAAALVFGHPAAAETRLEGAGALVPFQILATWFVRFAQDATVIRDFNPGRARVDYLATDGAAAVDDLIAERIDFAATDRMISDEQIKQMPRGAVVLPVIANQVVIAYNLPSVPALRLPRAVYPKIFSGDIASWNDPGIAAANPGIALPDLPITVVVRSDSASTTGAFTAHLSAIDKSFRDTVGAARSPTWPESERFVRELRNDGVTAALMETRGSIGYMELGYARLSDWWQLALLENRAGAFVAPGTESGMAAVAATAQPKNALPSGAPDLRLRLTDPSGEGAYPVAALTWLLFHAAGYDTLERGTIRGLIRYCTTAEAQGEAISLGYIPLPDTLLDTVRQAVDTIE
jgi:phosphate transport system substrate-binding protein